MVDLPEPDGPSTATTSCRPSSRTPVSSDSVKPCKTVLDPAVTPTYGRPPSHRVSPGWHSAGLPSAAGRRVELAARLIRQFGDVRPGGARQARIAHGAVGL